MKSVNDYSYPHVILWSKNGMVKHFDTQDMSLEFLKEDFDYMVFLKFDAPTKSSNFDIPDLIKSLDSIYSRYVDAFVVLTENKPSPPYSEWMEEYVYSFSCNFSAFKKIMGNFISATHWAERLLFKLLNNIFEGGPDFENVLVRQIPFEVENPLALPSCDVVIPNQGVHSHLPQLLAGLSKINQLKIYVGSDRATSSEIDNLNTNYSEVSFYEFSADPSGPAEIRNWMIDRGQNDLIFYQDPDDISCADRFEKIAAHMTATKVQLCGSHELRLDYFTLQVVAIRSPQHLNMPLEKEIGHSLFHHSSALSRNEFSQLGDNLSGIMTFKDGRKRRVRIGSGTAIYSVENIDEFLYIRRNRPHFSAPNFAELIEVAEREREIAIMSRDFDRVKRGEITLEESCLMTNKTTVKYNVKKL